VIGLGLLKGGDGGKRPPDTEPSDAMMAM
jgi:hypothetical protein